MTALPRSLPTSRTRQLLGTKLPQFYRAEVRAAGMEPLPHDKSNSRGQSEVNGPSFPFETGQYRSRHGIGQPRLAKGWQVDGEVCFGSLADTEARIRDVRFTLRSGHAHRRHRCLLCANSGRPAGRSIRPIVDKSNATQPPQTRTDSGDARGRTNVPHSDSLSLPPPRRA